MNAQNPSRLSAETACASPDFRLRPRALAWATRLTAGSAVLLATLLLVAPWQQFSSGAGQVIALSPMDREQGIDAPISGRVTRWFVQEGSQVKAGDPLLEMVDLDPDYVGRLEARRAADADRLAAAEAGAAAYSQQVEAYEQSRQMKVRSAEMKAAAGRQKLKAAVQKREAGRAELKAALAQVERQRGLAARGLISLRELELAELSVSKTEAELNSLEAAVNEAEATLTALGADRLGADAEGLAKVQTAEAALRKSNAEAAYVRGDLAKIGSDLARQASRRVPAPRDGTILSIDGNLGGQVVSAGQPLAVLVPGEGPRAVELWIDGNDAPLVQPGRKVRLQFEGWPAVQFVGWPSVAVGTFGGVVKMVDAASARAGSQRVVVVEDADGSPWPERRYLRLGGRAKAWVLLDEVTLGWELWRLINGFPLSVSREAAPAGGRAAVEKGKS